MFRFDKLMFDNCVCGVFQIQHSPAFPNSTFSNLSHEYQVSVRGGSLFKCLLHQNSNLWIEIQSVPIIVAGNTFKQNISTALLWNVGFSFCSLLLEIAS